jgi:hypothetical protein
MAWKEMLQVSAPPRKSNEAHWQGSTGIRMVTGSLPSVDIQLDSNASPVWGMSKRLNQKLGKCKFPLDGGCRRACRGAMVNASETPTPGCPRASNEISHQRSNRCHSNAHAYNAKQTPSRPTSLPTSFSKASTKLPPLYSTSPATNKSRLGMAIAPESLGAEFYKHLSMLWH